MPRITPYLYYEDPATALAWLARAFGFRERLRMPGPDGSVMHAEMQLADGVVMMGRPGPDYRSPKRLGQVTQSLYMYVDDLNAHIPSSEGRGGEGDRGAGGPVLTETGGTGPEDPEGHVWYFAQHVRMCRRRR